MWFLNGLVFMVIVLLKKPNEGDCPDSSAALFGDGSPLLFTSTTSSINAHQDGSFLKIKEDYPSIATWMQHPWNLILMRGIRMNECIS